VEMRYPQIESYFIVAQAREGQRDQAIEEVRAAVRRMRRTNGPDDFSLTTPDEIIKQFDSLTSMILLVSIAISALGLLVGFVRYDDRPGSRPGSVLRQRPNPGVRLPSRSRVDLTLARTP